MRHDPRGDRIGEAIEGGRIVARVSGWIDVGTVAYLLARALGV